MTVRNLTFSLIVLPVLLAIQIHAAQTGRSSPILRHALELADLNNWTESEPEFARAAAAFRDSGDRVGLEYAELGTIRATIQRRNLSITSMQLQRRLDSDPLIKSDNELRLFCLEIKGEIDGEMGANSMRKDWEEVAQLARESNDPRWRYRASAELGMVAFWTGDLQTALRNISAALLAATQIHDVGGQIKYLYAIGSGLNMTRMYSDAIQYLDKSIALSNATPGAPYPFLPLLAKADSLALTGQTAEAQKIINGMLESARNRNATMYEVNTLQTMARIHRASNDIGGAIGDLDLSIRLSEKSGYTRASVESQIDLADIYGSRGDLRKAEALLVSATTAAQKNGELYTLPQRLEILAELQVRQGKFGEADRTYDRAAAFVDANIGNDSAVLDKTALIKSVSDLYVGHFGVLAEHLDNPAKAYAVVEQVRGRVMSDLLLGGSAAPLKAQQNERAIARLRLRMMGATSTTEVEKFRDQISGLEQARWVTPEVSILKSRSYSHVPLREVQGALSSNATILEYVLADPISWCLVIRRHSANIVRLRGKQQIETAISSYLKTLKKKQVDPAAARDLYAALIQPVRQAGQAGDLMIVRDGLLNLLPFDALNEPSGDYVGERNVISYLPSAGTFYLLARQTARPNQNRKVLAVGGVPYDQAAEHFKNLIASQGFAATDLANLQNSREEATTATAGASEADKNLLVGSAATEAAVKKVAGESYRVIHLAVHSAVDTNRPDRAALILLDDPTAGEDGLLQGQEIAQMHLRTSLVVLSACDTAVGPIEGQEGVATLARSFLLAGAQNVISTLWAADDNSSLAVLKQFYAHLATGESAALSLAEAKRDFLAKFGPKAVPYYWAAFTFEGVPNTATILYDQERNTH